MHERPAAERDAAVLRRLQQGLARTDPAWLADLQQRGGWHNATAVCEWEGVACNARGRVTSISLMLHRPPFADASQAPLDPSSAAPLLPDLAGMDRLEDLLLLRRGAPPWPALPRQWLAPGAFPRLRGLSLAGTSLAAPLPELPPGVLPRLKRLQLSFTALVTSLPRSWGGDPAVLPALMDLSVHALLRGGTPAAWARGFRRLHALQLFNLPPGVRAADWSASDHGFDTPTQVLARQAAAGRAQRAGPAQGLPPEWAAAGAFPQLSVLDLSNLGAAGSLPSAWVAGGFPQLASLRVRHNELTGTLPAQLLANHPELTELWLDGNKLSGTLPDAWAASQIQSLVLAGNKLSGPAFPPSWRASGALRQLSQLVLSGNRGLTGTLPADVAPWPQLTILKLGGTGVHIPTSKAWCRTATSDRTLRPLLVELEPGLPAQAGLPGTPLHCIPLEGSGVWDGKRVPSAQARHAAAALAGLAVAALAGALLAASAAARALRQWRLQAAVGSAGSPPHRLPPRDGAADLETTRLLAEACRPSSAAGAGAAGAATEGGKAPWGLTRLDRLEALLNSRFSSLVQPGSSASAVQQAAAHGPGSAAGGRGAAHELRAPVEGVR